jgi:2,3,4,5-tetrahydropyridine-2-carboxylate N-succinyltransferase
MTILAFGLQRQRHQTPLDIWYPVIITDADPILELLSPIVSLKKEVFTSLNTTQLMDVAALIPDHISVIEMIAGTIASPKSTYASLTAGIMVLSSVDTAIISVQEAYLKLQLISQRHIKPHGLNLEGLFGILKNIVWTNKGPILPEDSTTERLSALANGQELVVSHVDKFPYLVNYHIPTGVRIVSGSQVRLGAYLGEGSTIMPAGYVNFNAGTTGNAMVEGRVSAGVFVDRDSDIGGGASIMGTLSGGNNDVISIGSRCLLGANSGVGISLGYGCTVEAGLYITAGMKILDQMASTERVVKAKELSGKDYLLFIKDSQTGQVICKPNTKVIALNQSLHQND